MPLAAHRRTSRRSPTAPTPSRSRAVDSASVPDPTPATRGFTIDATPPNTTIASGPAEGSTISDNTPTLTFSANEAGSSFECKVDSGPFDPCSSPTTLDPLTDGPHTFQVRATDPAGNPDPTAATRGFTIDATPPNTTIASGPAEGSTISDNTPTLTFSANEAGSSFECKVDSGPFDPCSSPTTLDPLTDGPHTFQVRATDPAGNPDPTAATRGFTIDATPPNTTIASGPAEGSTISDNTPTLTFSANEAGSSFECKVDSGPFDPCSSPTTLDPLTDGPHTFQVRATDPAGNPDPTAATRGFTIDATPPNTTIASGPAEGSTISDNTPTFSFSSDPGATFECKIDSGSFVACVSPITLPSLSDDSHTFAVRAIDSAANTDPTPAARTFTVDTASPDTTIDSGPRGTTSDNTPTFSFSSSKAGSSFKCRVDADPFAACSGPGDTDTLAPLSDGPHTFEVRATDSTANTDPTPAARSFTVDTLVPTTTITKRPNSAIKTKQKSTKVKVFFTSDPGATFECKLDKAKFKSCTSPYNATAKAKGGKGKGHTISIRATDKAGNVSEAAKVKFKVLRSPPLQGSVAKRTVITALERHDFARRVVKSVHVDCRRSSRYAFACRFSTRFPGYRLTGNGQVKLGAGISYGFRVTAQGVHLTLTDENEARRSH